MACLTDDCVLINGTYPECFTGTVSVYLDVNNTAVTLKFTKGNGSFFIHQANTSASGQIDMTPGTDFDEDFFSIVGGWYTFTAVNQVNNDPVGIEDSNGHGHSHSCIRFCVGPQSGADAWTYEIVAHPGGH